MLPRDGGLEPLLELVEQQRVRAERPAVAELEAGVAPPLALERGGDVALAVPGPDEHERHDVDGAVPGLHQADDGVLDRRRRELEEAALDVGGRDRFRDPLDELAELRAAGCALRAVPDDEQCWAHLRPPCRAGR